MDGTPLQYLSSVLYAMAIIGYGVYEYQRREKAHRIALQSLMAGEEPIHPVPQQALWRLLTLGAVEVCLMAAIIWLLSIHSEIRYGADVVYWMAGAFLAIFVALFAILIRDMKSNRRR